MNDGFNATAVVFAGITLTNKLVGVNFSEKAPEVDVTPANATGDIEEAGIPKVSVTIDLVGSVAGLFVGQKGPLAVTWNDAGLYGSITNAILLGIDKKGSKNGPITSTLAFGRSTASGT